jgi:hypothetical protein
VRNAVRVAAGGGEAPLVLIPEVKRGLLNTVGSTRLVLLQWDGREFVEKSGTPSINRYITEADFLSRDGFGKGGMIVASEIEQSGSVLKDKISRLILFRVE